MIIQRTPLSTADVFDLEAAAMHSRVDCSPDFYPDLWRMVSAAATEFETYAQVALLTQRVTVTLEQGPGRSVFELPIGPLIDALTVEITVDGMAIDAFAVITGQRPAVRFTEGRPCGLVMIQYEAGFGAAFTALPQDILNAIYDQTSALFDQRGAGDGKTNGMSPHMARVASRYRRVSI